MLIVLLSGVPPVAAGRRAPAATRDGTRVRDLASRPEEVRARREAVSRFVRWMDVASPGSVVEALARNDVSHLCVLFEEFCYQSYDSRWPVGSLRLLLSGLTDLYGWIRGAFSGPWKAVLAMEREEPGVPRIPLPVKWLEALVVAAISMSWYNMVASLLLFFRRAASSRSLWSQTGRHSCWRTSTCSVPFCCCASVSQGQGGAGESSSTSGAISKSWSALSRRFSCAFGAVSCAADESVALHGAIADLSTERHWQLHFGVAELAADGRGDVAFPEFRRNTGGITLARAVARRSRP